MPPNGPWPIRRPYAGAPRLNGLLKRSATRIDYEITKAENGEQARSDLTLAYKFLKKG